MRVAYLDCASGISGDMMLGALVDAGVSVDDIQQGIDSLGLPDCRLEVTEVRKHGFRASQVSVVYPPEHKHRHLSDIHQMIDRSQLTANQKSLAKRIFQRLGEAEAKVHGTTLEQVHFHEVGAADSIADIVGSAIGWDLLAVERIVCSPIPTGGGTITIAHGRVSVPAPATAELLLGIPLAASDVQAELTTPTGAAIAATIVHQFGEIPAMQVATVAYGAGTRDLEQQPNLLRLLVGQLQTSVNDQTVWILQTNLDDVPGEWIGYCTEQLGQAGALDVYLTPIQMKKGRPAVTLNVLCKADRIPELERIIFEQTGSLGIRRWPVQRHTLARRLCVVETSWGQVAGKVAILPDGSERFSPEYESCRELAETAKRPLHDIYGAACMAFDLSKKHA